MSPTRLSRAVLVSLGMLALSTAGCTWLDRFQNGYSSNQATMEKWGNPSAQARMPAP